MILTRTIINEQQQAIREGHVALTRLVDTVSKAREQMQSNNPDEALATLEKVLINAGRLTKKPEQH